MSAIKEAIVITTSKTTPEDVKELVDNIRYFDQLEVECFRGEKSAEELIIEGLEESEYTESFFTVDAYGDRKLLCIYGLNEFTLSDMGSPIGIPWMLGTNELFKKQYRVDVLRRGKRITDSMSKGYEVLQNKVHAHNYESHKFLRFCGFIVCPESMPEDIHNGEPFLRFHRIRG